METTLPLLVRGRSVTESTKKVKQACIFSVADREQNTFKLLADATPATPPPASLPLPVAQTTSSGRHVHFPVRFNI
jgi:hypothetical protein